MLARDRPGRPLPKPAILAIIRPWSALFCGRFFAPSTTRNTHRAPSFPPGSAAMSGPPPVYAGGDCGNVVGRTREIMWYNPTKLDPSGSIATPRHATQEGPLVGHIVEEFPPPSKLFVRSAVYGKITLDDLEPNTTLFLLKEQIRNRVALPPTKTVELTTWGLQLVDDWKTLQECRLKNNGQLDMRTALAQVASHGLERVRVVSTAIETRIVNVDMRTKGIDLKNKIHQALVCAEHAWYDKDGVRTAVAGVTLLATASLPANEAAALGAIRLGEELISTIPHLGEMGKGKPISVIRARKGGAPFNVNDTTVAALTLLPEKQKISFRGVEVQDATMLWALGCRSDDVIELEFESPAVPPILTLLRTPDKPKEGKKGGKKKGK